MKRAATLLALLAGAMVARAETGNPTEKQPLYGVLQDHPEHWPAERAVGLNVLVLAPAWSRYEPKPGFFDPTIIAGLRERLARARAAGFRVVLDPGWQYPPDWIFALPHSRYVNQYGEDYVDSAPGTAGFNSVFNAAVREHQAMYLKRLLADLGTDFEAIRLGGGKYNELNYPVPHPGAHPNCYWAFDDLAQGRATGLPAGVSACPVPGWIPGTPSAGPDDSRAGRFAEWYLDSLKNYHDWQIKTARSVFKGRLLMLYPSWGIRPGQLAGAVADRLSGRTSTEVNGEVQRGFDFARFIRGIADPDVVVYCTWIDAHTGNDLQPDPAHWEPVHYLSSLAQENPLRLAVWGENTGGNDGAAMTFSFEQARRYHLLGVVWAFERELDDGRHATA